MINDRSLRRKVAEGKPHLCSICRHVQSIKVVDDPANFVGLPQPIVDDVRKAIAARTRGPVATRGSAGQSQEEINAMVGAII